MRGEVEPPFKRKPGTSVHRLQTESGRTYYLKRSLPLPAPSVLRSVLRGLRRGRIQHTEAVRVQQAAGLLASLGISAMEIAAWGEERILGIWPRRGFVLARAVEGWDVAAAYHRASGPQRVRIMHAIGDVLGRLHANGLFVTLRLHDFIGTSPLDGEAPPKLTMIDLDFGDHCLRPGKWDRDQAAGALANACYLAVRCGHRFDSSELRAALHQYRKALRSCLLNQSIRRISDLVAAELEAHRADPRRIAMFPDVPRFPRPRRRTALAGGAR